MYLRQKHAVLNAMKKTERDAGVVLHTKKKIISSLYGGKTFGPGRDGGREGSDGQLRRCVLGRGVAVHFFLFFEPSESRSVWTDLKRTRASYR